jgi:hypothetical protein
MERTAYSKFPKNRNGPGYEQPGIPGCEVCATAIRAMNGRQNSFRKGDEGAAKFGGGWPKMAIFARGGQDALYPALSGEWEVPVTRNAKIIPVNEGGCGASPPGSPLVGSPVTRNAEIDPPPRLR